MTPSQRHQSAQKKGTYMQNFQYSTHSNTILCIQVFAWTSMCTSVIKSFRVPVAALVMVVVLRTCAKAALRVENDLEDANLTVLHPPGCCNYCTAEICTGPVCEVCTDVVVEKRKEVTLDIGLYPLEYLKVQVQDKVYCVPEMDLQHLTATALLAVGPGDCGQEFPNSISATIVDEEVSGPPDSGRFITCLQLCSAFNNRS
jgi:hypothetical protein